MKQVILFAIAIITGPQLFSQIPEFIISDSLVMECDGRLFDSGGQSGIYSINEDFTFTVCSETAIDITFQNEFCVENGLDFLSIYDGPNTSSAPLALNLTGTDLPGALTALSGCVTFHFTSDNSVAYCGFDILWNSQNIEPTPPTITFPNLPSCGDNILNFELSSEIYCSEIYLDESTLTGEEDIGITNFQSVNCDENGLANSFDLTLDSSIDYNCLFDLDLRIGVHDNCDSIWMFNVEASFLYDQCSVPIELLVGSNPLCNDECTTIEADVSGCFTYEIIWNNGLPDGAGPHEICPNGPLTYTATVTEIATGVTNSASFTFEHESVLIDQVDMALCQSTDPFELTATPSGGTWSGPGIDDEDVGWFNPDGAGEGLNFIYYEIDNSQCYDSIEIGIALINAGDITGSCPFAPPTFLNPSPPGGVWSGDNVSTDGLFSPQDVGTYNVTYEINGCSETLEIDVQNFTNNIGLQPICQSATTQYLNTYVTPSGGFWTGSGIDDGFEGTWEPESTGDGGLITLTYNLIGCSQDYEVDVIPSQIGGVNQNTCPTTEPFLLDDTPNPPGGFYGGNGIIDANTGLFDPGSVAENQWHELRYFAPNGCVDTVFMLVQTTDIGPTRYEFCIDDDPLALNWSGIQRTPWGGTWNGNGTVNVQNNDWEYFPDLAGVGEHQVFYENNGCIDSCLMVVYPNALDTESLTVCTEDEPFAIQEGLPAGGTWSGDGISNEPQGIFDPGLVPGITANVTYSTTTSCGATIEIVVDEFTQAEFAPLNSSYCFQDIDVDVMPFPEGGLLVGPEESGEFNPSVLGEGLYTYQYSFPENNCSADSTITFEVFPPAQVNVQAVDSILCNGGATVISATTEAGFPESEGVSIEWSDGLLSISEHTVSPEVPQYYYVTADDGCSDPVTDSIFISILDQIEVNYQFGDTLCYGVDSANVNIEIITPGNYQINWDGEEGSSTYYSPAGTVTDLYIVDTDYGCEFEDIILLESYPPISADFSVNPNSECIPFEANPIGFIDISQNAVSGNWDFGNGESMAYDGSSPEIEYPLAGFYQVSLVVENIGGCIDSASVEICVSDPSFIFIPDVFSPNDDGFNDVLFVRGGGLLEMELDIFNRWGELVFKSTDIDYGWDGMVRGMESPSGVYIYQFKARNENGEDITRKGDITLVR